MWGGYPQPGSAYSQAAGTIRFRNFSLSASSASVNVSKPLLVSATVTAQGYITTSDERIKNNISHASCEELQKVFNKIDVKTYNRSDVDGGSRVGFIAQDFQEALSDTLFQNIVHRVCNEEPTLGLDYSRLTCILWGVCKTQKAELAALADRVIALEDPKRFPKGNDAPKDTPGDVSQQG